MTWDELSEKKVCCQFQIAPKILLCIFHFVLNSIPKTLYIDQVDYTETKYERSI